MKTRSRGVRDQFVPRAWPAWLAVFTMLHVAVAAAQDNEASLFGTSSNLSGALPASEWERVEGSVDRGLAWLASRQEEDGRFPATEVAQPGVTALCVMAFLSRGHLPDQGPFGENITRGIEFVLETQNRQGCFSLLPVIPPAHHLSAAQTVHYNHAIAGLMLGEVYGMTSGERSERIEAAIAKALIYHREVQSWEKESPADLGGWRYGDPAGPKAASDISVTGWALMFLRSARNAEFNVPRQYFDEGLDFVERCYEPDPALQSEGVFRYRPTESGPDEDRISLANTSSAMLTLILGGRHEHPGVTDGIRWFVTHDYPQFWQNGYFYLTSYYSSQAAAQVGDETWNRVFPQIAANLLSAQETDGSWPLGSGNETQFGTAYTTSMAILALTPAYQLLPIYQR